jgi:tRNA-dihydrouridine synthase
MNKNYYKKEAEKGKLCFLAPMDGYWDSAYRQTMKRIAPNLRAITEFYSVDWLVHSKHLAENVLPHTNIEDPLVLQVFWKDPEMFAKAAKIVNRYNYAWIDVNMWCPAKKVVRSWHGSSLIINTYVAFKIIESLTKATSLPISVKTRISFDWNQDLINFWKGLENAWASMLTVHGRTMKQWYSGDANWDPIYELQNHLSIPVLWNWDVKNYVDWMSKVKNLAGFMIWRWSFWNPWCFLPELYYPTLREILDIMEFHAIKLVETKWEHKWSLEIRKHLVQYLKNFPWVKVYRKRLVTTESMENSINIINEIRQDFKNSLWLKPGLW